MFWGAKKQYFLRVVILGLLPAVMMAGIVQAADITGKVWNDANTNGNIDSGETGIPGVNIVLYNGTSCQTWQTDGSGSYAFNGLSAGSYSLYEANNRSVGVCPPTLTTATLPTPSSPPSVTQGSIQDLPGYASSTANRIDLNLSTGGISNQNFGDYQNPGFTRCPTDAFLIQGDPTDFFGINLATGQSSLLEGSWAEGVNGIGFNVLDDYIYGSVGGGNIARIGGDDGSGDYAINVLKVSGLPTGRQYVGTMSVDGHLYLNRGGIEVYVIDVNPQRNTYLSLIETIKLKAKTGIHDWAFDPFTQSLFGITSRGGHLVEVDLVTEVIKDHGEVTVAGTPIGNGPYGAIYFDVYGFMYFSRNSDGYIGRLDLRDPANISTNAIFFSIGPASSQNDGARCVFAPVPSNFDFGDAPALYGAPQHFVLPKPALYLGAVPPDVELAHQPSVDAKGDDDNDTSGTTAGNDEDTFSIIDSPTPTRATVHVFNNTGNPFKLCFWYDVDANGAFDGVEARCTKVETNWTTDGMDVECSGVGTKSGQCKTTTIWAKPAFDTYARVRVTSDLGMGSGDADGFFSDGEVNDLVHGGNVDAGDAPVSYGDSKNSLFSPVFKSPYLGAVAPDADATPYYSTDATRDNNTGINDEKGVTFRSPAGSGESIFADVVFANPGGTPVTVCAWLDVAINGQFDSSDGQCQNSSLTNGTLTFQWSGLPADQAYTTFARFRVSSTSFSDANSTGLLGDGETEDYQLLYDFTPTSVSIGKVDLKATRVTDFIAGLSAEQINAAALLELLATWDPGLAATLAGGWSGGDTLLGHPGRARHGRFLCRPS